MYYVRKFNNIIALLLLSGSLTAMHETPVQEYMVVNEKGVPSSDLNELLKISEINHDGTLQSIVNLTQKSWLEAIRPNNAERWEVNNEVQEKFERKREQILPLLNSIGLCQKRAPKNSHYDHAVLLGATLERFCTRLAYFLSLDSTHIKFDSIVVLVGERPLNASEENKEKFLELLDSGLFGKKDFDSSKPFPTNEADMSQYVLDSVDMPAQWRSKIMIIRSPMKQTVDGKAVRPTTGDTVTEWLKTNPKSGTIAAFSNQPYCLYQESVLKTLLPREFSVEAVGEEAKEDLSVALYLDTLARILYQENKRIAQ
jgi:hypothetical protein